MKVSCMAENERQTRRGRKKIVYSVLFGLYLIGDADPLKVLSREMHGQVCLLLVLIWQQNEECI